MTGDSMKIEITSEDVQALIDTLHQLYPGDTFEETTQAIMALLLLAAGISNVNGINRETFLWNAGNYFDIVRRNPRMFGPAPPKEHEGEALN